ncbi:thioesterase II family protein [Actinophytocola glycyrrhizae]|uniref:Thioesterase II family protein n=1 Tax=Actinophytocola glycyrrhizae TaxID=2044873 RepID=A0ABV9RTI6_9PSEU
MTGSPRLTYTTFRRPLTQPRRLFCFPYAGGGENLYRDWAGRVPGADVVAPRFAGRGSRFTEPAETDFAAVLDELVQAIEPLLNAEIALFGHSLGGLLAFEVGRSLAARGHRPALLIVSGCAAPRVISSAPKARDLSEIALRAELAEFGLIPREALENDQLMDLLLPVLRADLDVQNSYRVDPAAPPLDCPLHLYYGSDEVAEPDRLRRTWAEVVSGPIDVSDFPGGHFFVNSARQDVLAAVCTSIARTTGVR